MLPFDSAKLFLPLATRAALTVRAQQTETLADLYRICTLVPGPSDRRQAEAILSLFGLDPSLLQGDHGMERFWEIITDIRQQVSEQMLLATGEEYKVDWSRADKAFCLWYRHRDTRREAVRDLAFVHRHTLRNLHSSEIRESSVHGFGLFSTADIPEATILGILDGQLIDFDAYEQLHHHLGLGLGRLRTFFFMEWNAVSAQVLLARPFRTYYSYINHSISPNLEIKSASYDSSKLLIRTLRAIPKDTELFLDYRKEALPLSYFQQQSSRYLEPLVVEKKDWQSKEDPSSQATDPMI